MELLANWPFTRWGMTADEIVVASRGSARKLENGEQVDQSGTSFTTLATAELREGPFEFDVSFRAEKDGFTLKTVRLELRESEQYPQLRDALCAKYGPGDVLPPESAGAIERLRWVVGTDTVVLQRLTWPMDLGVDVVIDFETSRSS